MPNEAKQDKDIKRIQICKPRLSPSYPYRDDSTIRPITASRRVHQSAAKPDWHPDAAPGKPQLPKPDSIPARFSAIHEQTDSIRA